MGRPSNNINILLIEDNQAIAKAYCEGLKRAGFNVYHLPNGKNVVTKIKSICPDVILLDIIMPKQDGFDVLEVIKKARGIVRPEIVILSNLFPEDYKNRLKGYGVSHLLTKVEYTVPELIKYLDSLFVKAQ